MHAVDHGSPHPGAERVLLVHGLGGSTVSWEPSSAMLADALQTQVTAIDLPGFGLTRLEGRPADLTHYRDLVIDMLDREGPAIIVGNSMGGAVAVAVGAERPDLVPSLVLVDPALPRPLRSLDGLGITARFGVLSVPRLGEWLIGYQSQWHGPIGMVDNTLRAITAYPERIDPTIRERLVQLSLARWEFEERVRSYLGAARSLVRYLARPMQRDLDRITAPTLVIHGSLDALVSIEFARAHVARRPDWTLIEIDDVGHIPHLEAPQRFVDAVVTWLAGGAQLRAS